MKRRRGRQSGGARGGGGGGGGRGGGRRAGEAGDGGAYRQQKMRARHARGDGGAGLKPLRSRAKPHACVPKNQMYSVSSIR